MSQLLETIRGAACSVVDLFELVGLTGVALSDTWAGTFSKKIQ
jgi:hypothetical protein